MMGRGSRLTPPWKQAGEALKGAEPIVTTNLDDVVSPFDIADDLENGFMAEAVLSKEASTPVRSREPFRRCCIFHLADPAEEYHLLSETGDMLLTAKYVRRERRLEFYLADEATNTSPQSVSSSKRSRPAFTMSYSENNDNWVLKQTSCEHCAHRPKHMSCESLGKAQQVAFIQHSRRRAGKALVHFVDVRIPPALRDDAASMVWCPVTLGRDLSDRSPASRGNSDASPVAAECGSGTPSRRRSGGNVTGYLTPTKDRFRTQQLVDEEDPLQLCTKMPAWDEELESLVLNFHDRTVQSSPMNFMLCADPEGSSRVVMQHAKMCNNTYSLDFKHPLSTIQAFAVALTALLWD